MSTDPRIDRIQLGATYRDRLTGFEGIAIGRYDYLTGCTRVTLQSTELTPEGKTMEITVDQPMVEFVKLSRSMKQLRDTQQRNVATDPSAAG